MPDIITLAHGAGGGLSRELIENVFLPAFDDPALSKLNDSSLCPGAGQIALTTDSFVVKPLFFPGGDIGTLAVSGTVNDLAVSGARPAYLTVGMILEAGLSMETLRRVTASMAQTAKMAGVRIVTGDTKVVEQGRGDGIYINTAGVGLMEREPLPQRPMPGDMILVSGPIASHGLAVLCAREGLGFDPPIQSDAAPLNGLIAAALAAGRVNAMRDATRGGLTATICEWAEAGVRIEIEQEALPILPGVRAAAELLGLEPMHMANEGVAVFSVPQTDGERVLAALRAHPLGRGAARIGQVKDGPGGGVLVTPLGTRRRLFLPRGEILPRIC